MASCFASHCNLGELVGVMWLGWCMCTATLQGLRQGCLLPSPSRLPSFMPCPLPLPLAAQRALLFLKSEAARMGQPYTPAQEATMRDTLDILKSIPQQLRKHISPKPQPTVQELKSMGKWLDAPQLVQLVVRLKVSRVRLGWEWRGKCTQHTWGSHTPTHTHTVCCRSPLRLCWVSCQEALHPCCCSHPSPATRQLPGQCMMPCWQPSTLGTCPL